MAYRHLLRLRRRVRIGGFGPLFGGTYTVGPLSVIRCVQALPVIGEWGASLPSGEAAIKAAAGALGARMFAPLVSILIEEPVEPRHLTRVTAAQVAQVFQASEECNDWAYILKALTPSGGGEAVGADVIIVGLAEALHLDPRSLLTRPMQEVLAYGDALAELHRDPEKGEELDDKDRDLLGQIGLV